MNSAAIAAALDRLAIGPIQYFEQIDSTNVEAARWVEKGCPDLALIVADEQTAGRGRAGRRWFTPAGTALAFSLVLKAGAELSERTWSVSPDLLPRVTALGALAVCETLQSLYGLPAQIKWPNDVLCFGRKCCGVLAEALWQGEELAAIILGIGINVKPASVPPDEALTFPATCIETAVEESGMKAQTVDRPELLEAVVKELLNWQPQVGSDEFIQAWEKRLAYLNQWVRVSQSTGRTDEGQTSALEGQVLGLEPDGRLRLRDRSGKIITIRSGELNLRPK